MRPVHKGSAQRPPKASPRSSGKKPKFEVPQEAGLPPSATWVYREAEAAAPVTPPPASAEPGSFLVGGLEVTANGLAIFAKANAVAFRVITAPLAAPFRLVSRFF